ncbi:MAG: GNAT family N-acetyltransferase [Anaerolineae bacterium]|nr:GNAT family N-acetyltransferase [Anaerolineae bacterium]
MTFYPAGCAAPLDMRTSRLYVRPLRATDVELDYDAVMSSAEMLRRWCQGDWPRDGFTPAENLADLQRHEREHIERTAFTYTVLDPQGTRCLGCVYVVSPRPEEIPVCRDAAHAADVAFWVRASEVANGLDQHLLACLREWFNAEWAFDRVLFRVGTQDDHHTALFEASGLSKLLTYASSDGRRWCMFG